MFTNNPEKKIINDNELIDVFQEYIKLKGGKPLNISEGVCFGAALCHGLFATINRTQWWQAILEAIVQWDKERESLNNLMAIPLGEKVETYTMESLILMAGNFILNHDKIDLTADKFEIIENRTQHELIIPNGPLCIVTKEQGVKKIEDKISLVLRGTSDLEKFITKLQMCYPHSEVVCLIYKRLHVCSLRCDNGIYFYNSNYGETGPIGSIDDLWELTHQNYGPAVMGIDVISFDNTIDLGLRNLCEELTKNSLQKLDGEELRLIARILPHLLPQILVAVENDAKYENFFADALADQQSLFASNSLGVLIMKTPAVLSQLFSLIEKKPGLHQKFVEAISCMPNDISTFELLIDYAPDSLPKLFDLAEKIPILFTSLEDMLLSSDFIFIRMANHASPYLSDFYALLKHSSKLPLILDSFMLMTISNEITALQYLIIFQPKCLRDFLQLIGSDNPDSLKTFSQALRKQTCDGLPTLHLIIIHAKDCLPKLIELAKNNREIMQTIYELIPIKVGTRLPRPMDGFELLACYAPEFQSLFYDLVNCKSSLNGNINSLFSQQHQPINISSLPYTHQVKL